MRPSILGVDIEIVIKCCLSVHVKFALIIRFQSSKVCIAPQYYDKVWMYSRRNDRPNVHCFGLQIKYLTSDIASSSPV